jgi:hypothetical protein
MSSIKSDSGKQYQIEGDYQSGYRLKDENGNRSAYSFDDLGSIKKHINNVEKGFQNDINDFADYDDDYDCNDSQDDLEQQFEEGGHGVLASLTADGYEYYKG